MAGKTDIIIKDIKRSEDFEVKIFFEKAKEFYSTSEEQGGELYDIAFGLTDGFRVISHAAVLEDPRIIKVLRYITIPLFSQMKLGQFVGENTTASYEGGKKPVESTAKKIVEIVSVNLDYNRFIWLNLGLSKAKKELAEEYARRWTCSLIANQNALTAFRNWRKDIQENNVAQAVLDSSYALKNFRAVINKITDILPGEFVKENRIRGTVVQKADFVIRLKKTKVLLAVEAKAVGVRIDAYKRMKEIRDKKNDWTAVFGNDIVVGAVLAGFIPVDEVRSLINAGIKVFWEHNLKPFASYLKKS